MSEFVQHAWHVIGVQKTAVFHPVTFLPLFIIEMIKFSQSSHVQMIQCCLWLSHFHVEYL